MSELAQQSTEQIKTENTEKSPPSQAVATQTNEPIKQESEQLPENPQEINWRKFREQREIERKARLEADKRAAEKAAEAEALRKALEAVVNKPTNQHSQTVPHNYYNEDIEESEEQRIERKVAEMLSKKEQEYEQRRQQQEAQEYPNKLRSAFKDFDQVVTEENMDYLEYHHPELAKSLGSRSQSFDKWADVYSSIKRYVPNLDSKKEIKRAEENMKKPQSGISTATPTPSSNNDWKSQEERRRANWERMQRTLKGLS